MKSLADKENETIEKNFPLRKISVLHPYLEDRIHEIEKGLYPRHHLWGMDGLKTLKGVQIELLRSNSIKLPPIFERVANRFFFRNSPGIKAELSALRASRRSSLVYSVCGPLSLLPFFGKAKLVSWVFRKPKESTKGFFSPYSPEKLKRHAAFLCLTKRCRSFFAAHSLSKFMPWCVDMKVFDGKPPSSEASKPFFLATGKTGRDFNTLIEAAKLVSAEIRIIGPKNRKPLALPANVLWLDGTSDPPDKAIDYPTLREWYAQCTATLIPLHGDTEDTCGYTNLLESMAMRKAVIMTRSGCLDVDPETLGFGFLVSLKSPQEWAEKIKLLSDDSRMANELGNKGRQVAEMQFSENLFNSEIRCFFDNLLTQIK